MCSVVILSRGIAGELSMEIEDAISLSREGGKLDGRHGVEANMSRWVDCVLAGGGGARSLGRGSSAGAQSGASVEKEELH